MGAYGIVPRSAKDPGVPPAADQSTIISASRRALSRLPDASKCGSAASKVPSTDCNHRMVRMYDKEAEIGSRINLCKGVRQRNDGVQDLLQGRVRAYLTI